MKHQQWHLRQLKMLRYIHTITLPTDKVSVFPLVVLYVCALHHLSHQVALGFLIVDSFMVTVMIKHGNLLPIFIPLLNNKVEQFINWLIFSSKLCVKFCPVLY